MARRRRSRSGNCQGKGKAKEINFFPQTPPFTYSPQTPSFTFSPQTPSITPSGESAVVGEGLIISSQHHCCRNEQNKGKAVAIYSFEQAPTFYPSDDESVGSCSPSRPPPIPVIDLGD